MNFNGEKVSFYKFLTSNSFARRYYSETLLLLLLNTIYFPFYVRGPQNVRFLMLDRPIINVSKVFDSKYFPPFTAYFQCKTYFDVVDHLTLAFLVLENINCPSQALAVVLPCTCFLRVLHNYYWIHL